MRIVVFGACGLLGREVVRALRLRQSNNVVALCHNECDVTSRMDVLEAIEGGRTPTDIVINCAAYTDVDGAEDDPATAHMVNGYGPWNILSIIRDTNTKFIHLSSDYVFSGSLLNEESYYEMFQVKPLNAYGRSKLDGEKAVLGHRFGYVIRGAWLYGDGSCFPRTILNAARTRDVLSVVNDQRGNPTYAYSLAQFLAHFTYLLSKKKNSFIPRGVYHAVSKDAGTWYDLARETFRLAGLDPERIRAVSSSEFPRRAVRPTNSALASSRVSEAGLTQLPAWRSQLQLAFDHGIFKDLLITEN